MIQNHNIKFKNASTTSMKNTSPNSLNLPIPNSKHKQLNSLSCDSPRNEMDHNLSCRDPIWVIQKPNIKFTIAATNFMKNTSPNPSVSQLKTSPKF